MHTKTPKTSRGLLGRIREHLANEISQPSNRLYISLLVLVGFASHIIWFTPGTILFHADWLHWTDTAAQQAWLVLGTWSGFFGFGSPRVQIGFTLIQDLWSLITNLGGSFDTAVKLTLMIPITILGFVSPYLLIERLTKDKFIAFVTALFYGSTTYFLLRQGSHLPIAFVYAWAPIMFLLFINAIEGMKTKAWVLFALAYTLGLCYEVRIMYIFTFILLVYIALFPPASSIKELLKKLPIPVFLVLFLNSFWIMPTFLGGTSSSVSEITGRGLFGDFLFDLPHSLALSVSSWTGGVPNENFIMQAIPIYLWLIPLVVFMPLAISRKYRPDNRKLTIFFLIFALLGIFLTKQSAPPLPDAYGWLYGHFPGFSLFREASKFYLFTAWGYMGLLALGLLALRRTDMKLFFAATTVTIGIAGINLLPLVTGDMRSLFVSRHIPDDYRQFNQQIASENDFYRTLWVPADSQWANFDKMHPKVSLVSAMQQNWKSIISTEQGPNVQQQFFALFNEPSTDELLDNASIKFVVVPLRDIANEDDFFRYYGDNRQFYIDTLDNVSWLERINVGEGELAVYQNKDFKPYLSTAKDLLTFPSLDNLKESHRFSNDNLNTSFNFALNGKLPVERGTEVRDIFHDIDISGARPDGLSASIKTKSSQPTLYTNVNKWAMSYLIDKATLNLSATKQSEIKVNDSLINSGQSEVKNIGSSQLNPDRQYFFKIDTEVTPVNIQPNETHNLNAKGESVSLISTDTTNLIVNPYLENGPWQQGVEDCDNYDERPEISMDIINDERPESGKSIALRTFRHTACTGPNPVPISDAQPYMLSFDYRTQYTDRIGYQIIFNDPKQTTIKRFINAGDNSWHVLRLPIVPPQGATSVTIKLLGAPSSLISGLSTTLYDNLKLSPYTTEISTDLGSEPQYIATPLTQNKNTFTYIKPGHVSENLILNPSFEDGLWQKEVSDCNAHDDKPLLKMHTSQVASEGRKSLELAAKNHNACTGPGPIEVKENATYLLSFEARSPNTKTVSYSINFDNPDKTSTTQNLPITNKWQSFTRTIKVPPETHKLYLSVSANANGARNYTVNLYDNFKFIEVPDIQDQFYLVDSPGEKLTEPKNISYSFEEPTRKQVQVTEANGPFYLTMSDAYSPNWRLELDNIKAKGPVNRWSPLAKPDAISQKDHIKWDDFMNGWYVDPAELCKDNKAGCRQNADGSYDLKLVVEFTPQRWFYVGSALSGITIVGCIVYLLYTRHSNRASSIIRKNR